MEPRVVFSGHIIGLLKEYMQDLVDQAKQEAQSQEQFGFTPPAYRPDQAISDLLALLDDRIESEGVQVGLPDGFLHEMWTCCNQAVKQISNHVWLERNLAVRNLSKDQTRELTYRALIDFLESRTQESG
ncbi:MAG: hypothetical protein IPM58_06595 [Nitrospira sp.]|nr:hypothetical protein [Nitrospira sp.]